METFGHCGYTLSRESVSEICLYGCVCTCVWYVILIVLFGIKYITHLTPWNLNSGTGLICTAILNTNCKVPMLRAQLRNQQPNVSKCSCVSNLHQITFNYRPQRSCGQGNVFTGVCLSTGGEGVCLSACWDAMPPWVQGDPPGTRETPWDQGDPPRTRETPQDQGDPPGPGRPPPDQGDPPGPGRLPRPGRPPRDQADPPGTRHTPRDQADSPRKQTPAYRLQAAGTHPTGMHSCFFVNFHQHEYSHGNY